MPGPITIEDSAWLQQLTSLSTENWSASDFVALAFLCTDSAERFLSMINWILNKGVVLPDDTLLLDLLRAFYFDNVTDPSLREAFYTLFKERSDVEPIGALATFYRLAQTHFIGDRSCSNIPIQSGESGEHYSSINLLGESINTETKIPCLNFQNIQVPKIKLQSLQADWSAYNALFGDDFIRAIQISSRENASWLVQKLVTLAQGGVYSYGKLWGLLSNYPGNELLNAMAIYYTQPSHFKEYLAVVVTTPRYLSLISLMDLSQHQKQEVGRLSARVFTNFIAALEANSIHIKRACTLYLSLESILLADRQVILKNGILDAVLLLGRDSRGGPEIDIEDALVLAITQCGLLEFAWNRVDKWLEELSQEQTYQAMIDLWRDHEGERSVLKRIYPQLRHGHYPYDTHELNALFLEQRFVCDGNIQAAWSEVCAELQLETSTDQAPFWHRALVTALLRTRHADFIRKLMTLPNDGGVLQPADNSPWWATIEVFRDLVLRDRFDTLSCMLGLTLDIGPELREALKNAVAVNKWDGLIGHLVATGQWGMVTYILNFKGDDKASSHAVRGALDAAIVAEKWDVVRCIINLNGNNKPLGFMVERVVKPAIAAEKWGIVIGILNLKGDNKPCWAVVDDVFKTAVAAEKWDIVIGILNLKGDNKLLNFQIDNLLQVAADNGQLEVVKCILDLNGDNKPNWDVVGKALNVAVTSKKWDVATCILNLEGDNQPNTPALEAVIEAIVNAQKWDVVSCILNKVNTRPINDVIERALENAINVNQWDTIEAILRSRYPRARQYNAQLLVTVLNKAAAVNKPELVKKISSLFISGFPKNQTIRECHFFKQFQDQDAFFRGIGTLLNSSVLDCLLDTDIKNSLETFMHRALEEAYKIQGGGYLARQSIFGVLSRSSLLEAKARLEQRSLKNPEGPSHKTRSYLFNLSSH